MYAYHDGIVPTEPILDISDEVNSQADHGLVGFVLDPSFLSNGYFYMMYVVDRHHLLYSGTDEYDPLETIVSQASIGRVTRYQADKATNFNSVIQGSRHILLGNSFEDGMPILMTGHSTGSLVFGTDGTLMISFGDGGSFEEKDIGNAMDTYHEQSLLDGTISDEQNVGSFRSMLKSSACGKLLRIDPQTGKGVSTNPFYDINDDNSFQSKVWSLGFRNPYKFMKVPGTGSHKLEDGNPGTFLLGDVGSSHWEELNLIEESGNWYGWPFFEGHRAGPGFLYLDQTNKETNNPADNCEHLTFRDISANLRQDHSYKFTNSCDPDATVPIEYRLIHKPPLLSYSSNQWNPPAKTTIVGWDENDELMPYSISNGDSGVEGSLMEGGTILPGGFNQFDIFPEEYGGKFFLGDYMGTIHTLTFDEDFSVKTIEPFASGNDGITDIKFNQSDGHLYVIHYIDNSIYKIGYGGPLPPTIITEQNVRYGPSPLNVIFDASNSVTNSDTPISFRWIISGDTVSSSSTLDRTFESEIAKSYEVTLIVKDELGLRSTEKYYVSVNNTPPKVRISSIEQGDTYTIDDINTIILEAEVSDDEFQNSELEFSWRIDLYHDEHFHPGPEDNRQETVAFIDPIGCGLEFYRYKVLLDVTDPAGLTTSDTVVLLPYCGERFVEVYNFSALEVDNIVRLDWEVLDDDRVTYYEIERSDDFIFRTIGKLDKSSDSDYSFVDNNPFIGNNKYRIKPYNMEGNYIYSDEIEIVIFNENEFLVYPNPAFDKINVIAKNSNEKVSLSVIDITGKQIYSRELEYLNESKNIKEEVDVSEYASGIYYILIKSKTWSRQTKIFKF